MDSESKWMQHQVVQCWTWKKKADKRRLVKYRYPCTVCARGKVLARATIRKHLRRYKRDSAFTKSILLSNLFAIFKLNCIVDEAIEL